MSIATFRRQVRDVTKCWILQVALQYFAKLRWMVSVLETIRLPIRTIDDPKPDSQSRLLDWELGSPCCAPIGVRWPNVNSMRCEVA